MTSFGELRRVELRTLWPHEARHFTSWLAENLQLLGNALGMDLEMLVQEAAVGPFSLDILAQDVGRNRVVIIENQLEATNHDHLGKLLTYAAGHDAAVAVWVAPEFRDEHRQALDWLNQRTDTTTEFFGVVVEALQIDDSRPAPNFRLVAFPNDWRKSNIVPVAQPTPRGLAQQEFFQGLIDRLRTEYRFTQARKAQAQSWYSFASGIGGISYTFSFVRGDQVQAETYIDRLDQSWNKWLFDELHRERHDIEAEFGESLLWQKLDGKRASRIAARRPGAVASSREELGEIEQWGIDQLLRFKQVLGRRIAALAKGGPSLTLSDDTGALQTIPDFD